GGGGAGGGAGGGSGFLDPSGSDGVLTAGVKDGSLNNGDGEGVGTWGAPPTPTPALSTPAAIPGTPGGPIAAGPPPPARPHSAETITFKLYGPSDQTCGSTALATSTEKVVDNGSYSSAAFTANMTGVYHWVASYGGDGNNAAVTGSCGDQGEISVVGVLTPSVTTSAAQGTGVPGESATDSATVTGAAETPTGTVTFFLCDPTAVGGNPNHDCATGGTKVGSTVQLGVDGKATSGSTAATTTVGTYCWRAEYSGDAIYTAAVETNSTTEC